MFDFEVSYPDSRTSVVVRPAVLSQVGTLLRAARGPSAAPRVFLVSDTTVGGLYADRVLTSLRNAGFVPDEFRIVPGEASKSLRVAEEVYRAMAEAQLGRDSLLLALGGGVVSDLTGFIAATWMRGVPFAICPTTLEADVDASLGGKTAVNIPAGKNLVGAFHQPVVVAVDPDCLTTLDPRDVRSGMAESIKHGLITSEELVAWHEDHADRILALEGTAATELILKNLRVKANVVTRDPGEQTGARIMLNLGHTIGHAIEARCGFTLRHGECVALGTLACARLSERLGLLERPVVDRIARLLDRFGLPTSLGVPIATDDIITTLRRDKKARDGKVQFVLLEGLGRPVVRHDVPEDLAAEAYESLLD